MRNGSLAASRAPRRMVVLAVLIALVVLPGCSRLNKLLGRPTVAAAKPVLRIGLVGAPDGPQGLEGFYSGDGAQLAVDTIDGAGGVLWHGRRYDLALTFSGGDAMTRVRELSFASPPIVALIGPDDSASVIATETVPVTADVPEFTLATDPAITDPSQDQNDSLIFRVRPPDTAWAQAAARYAIERLGARSIALVLTSNPYGVRGGSAVNAALSALGTTPATVISLAPGLVDASGQVSAIQASGADTIICACTDGEAATLAQALHAASWPGHFVDTALDADFMAEAGPAGNGVVGVTSWTASNATPGNAAFVAAFQKQSGTMPDAHAAALYDAVTLIAAGIKAVGANHDALARYFAGLRGIAGVQGMFDAIGASQAYDSVGDLATALDIVRDDNGQMTLLAALP